MRAGREPASMNAASRMLMNPRLARIRPDRFTLFLIAVALLGAGLVLARQVTYGVSLHWDSFEHISTARSLLAGGGLFTPWGAPYEWWPPLFPMLLAAGSFGIFDPQDVAGPLNAVCFGLTVLVAGHWLRRHLRSRLLVVWGCLAIALALPVAWIAAWAMSEAPFILFTTLALTRTSAFVREPRRSTLLWAAVFTALACLTRYMGIAVVVTVVLILLFQNAATMRAKAQRIAGYGLIASLPIGLFFLRNYILVGDLTSSRMNVDYSLPDILGETLFHLGGWAGLYRPADTIDETVRSILGATVALVVIALGFWIQTKTERRKAWRFLYPFIIILPTFYILHVIGMFRGNTWHGINERHLIPLYIPLFLVVISMIDQTIAGFQRIYIPGIVKALIISISIVLSGWIGYTISLNNINEIKTVNSSEHREGYQAGIYTDSEVIDFIRGIPYHRKIIGNISKIAIYFHAYRFFSYEELSEISEELISEMTVGDYVIFSVESRLGANYTIGDLRTIPVLEEIISLRDGVIFRVSGTHDTIIDEYDTILLEEPVVSSEFDIYVKDQTLVYSRESCEDSILDVPFFLHITPIATQDLRTSSRPHGFDDLALDFRSSKRYDPIRCISSVVLPEYPIATIRTGQYEENRLLWSAYLVNGRDFFLNHPSIRIISRGGNPSVEVYRDNHALVYMWKSCEIPEMLPRFFLHITPHDRSDLPDGRRSHGFENRNFSFQDLDAHASNLCTWSRPLPRYPIACIRTGQFYRTGEGYQELWSMGFLFRDSPTERDKSTVTESRPCP